MNARTSTRWLRIGPAALVAAILAISSCGGGGDEEGLDSTDGSAASTSIAVSTTLPPITPPPTAGATTTTASSTTSGPAQTEPPATEAPTTTQPPAPTTTLGTPLVSGLAQIALVQPDAEASARTPLFEWQPIAGAASYRLVVGSPAGPIWAWEGTATSVRLGGLNGERPASFGGPEIVAGSSWSVVALDPAGVVVAVSEVRQVGPT